MALLEHRRGGEKVESVNISAVVKNTGSTDFKKKTNDKKDCDNSFSKVINNKLAKVEDTTAETKTQDMNNEANKPTLDNGGVDTDDKIDKSEPSEKSNEQLMQLIQLLTTVGTTVNEQGIDKVKQMISELLLGRASGENSDNKIKSFTLDFKAADLNSFNIDKLINADKNLNNQVEPLVSNIVDKLAADLGFKEQLLSSLNKVIEVTPAGDSTALKDAIIKELSSLVKHEGKLNIGSSIKAKDFEALNNLQPAEMKQVIEKINFETIGFTVADTNNKEPQFNSKPASKEDKILKDLLMDSDTKSAKENITDKITNVVTRFENIKTEKPVTVEAPVTITKSNFDMDFIKAVKFMDTNNLKELSVKILPKDLGEIVIRLSMDNGVMKANITASNKETYNLLNSQLPSISNQLAEQNMNIQSFNLSLYNGDNFLFGGDGGSQGERRQQGRKGTQVNGIDSGETLTQSHNIEDSNINALA